MSREHWSPDEDAVLRARYLRDGAPPIARDLGRSESGVWKRAVRLRLVKSRRWTDRDLERLRLLWETTAPLSTIARELGRTPLTVYWRAQRIGLPLGVPEGYEYVTAAAARAGYALATLWRILAWAQVPVRPVRARRARHQRRSMHYVDPFDVDEAIARWLRAEPLDPAARRCGISGETLKRWLLAAGHQPPKRRKAHWRVLSTVIDQVVAQRAPRRREAARAA